MCKLNGRHKVMVANYIRFPIFRMQQNRVSTKGRHLQRSDRKWEAQLWQICTAGRLERECTEDTTLNGVEVPKGLLVCSSVYTIHHDPTTWPEPEKFNPYRYNSQIRTHFPVFLLFISENQISNGECNQLSGTTQSKEFLFQVLPHCVCL